jgi:hypothetical protein
MKFNAITDIDRISLYERAFEEAKLIYDKNSTRRNRTLEEILEACLYGHAAEVYLMDIGFSNDPRPYKDLLEKDGTPIEVKVTEGEYYVPYVLERAERAASEPWRDYPKKLYVFIGNRQSLDYHLHGIYVWDGKNFCVQPEINGV